MRSWSWVAIGTFVLVQTPAFAQWTLIYEEGFDPCPVPAWDTNNSDRYYCTGGAYRTIMYDNTSEYGTVRPFSAQPYAGQSFKLVFDLRIDEMNYGGNIDIGLYDDSRECYYHSPSIQMVKLDFAVASMGRGIELQAWDDAGVCHFSNEYPTSSWEFGQDYTATIVYDAADGTVSSELRDRSSGELLNALEVSGVSGFSSLEHLGASKVSDVLLSSAYGSALIDNVFLYVPEPATLFLFAFGGLMLRRRQRR